jgi:hypothetical protein
MIRVPVRESAMLVGIVGLGYLGAWLFDSAYNALNHGQLALIAATSPNKMANQPNAPAQGQPGAAPLRTVTTPGGTTTSSSNVTTGGGVSSTQGGGGLYGDPLAPVSDIQVST